MIGHRGAPGYLPDHTLQGYGSRSSWGRLRGAGSRGHQGRRLIARHEPNITATTDVSDHPSSAARMTVKTGRRRGADGWFASDFTLAEIKTLGAKQPFPERPQRFNGRFEIPTLEEVISLVKRESGRRRRKIGIYPRRSTRRTIGTLGLPLERRLVTS